MSIMEFYAFMIDMERTKKTCDALETSTKYELAQSKKVIKKSHALLALVS